MALDNSTLNKTTALNPAVVEKKKTRQQKAEDVIYTLNHSITCLGVTDTFGLVSAANLVNKIFGTKYNLAHDHNTGYGFFDWAWDRVRGKHKDPEIVAKWDAKEDKRINDHHKEHGTGPYEHKHEHHEHHEHHKHATHEHHEHHEHHHAHKPGEIQPHPSPKLTPGSSATDASKKLWNVSKKWLLAEAVGDLGAVPFTIMLQRHAPGFMNTVRKGLEPIIGGAFKKNTHRAAVNWGKAHGKDKDSEEVKEYGNKLYEYEMHHMPQMAVWTVSSVLLNFGAMHTFHKVDPHNFERTSLKEFAMVKGLGAAFTAALVLGVRGFTPGGAHKWDETIGKKVIVPITKKVGGVFGVKAEDVDSFQKKRADITHGETKAPATEVTDKQPAGRVQEQPELAAQV